MENTAQWDRLRLAHLNILLKVSFIPQEVSLTVAMLERVFFL